MKGVFVKLNRARGLEKKSNKVMALTPTVKKRLEDIKLESDKKIAALLQFIIRRDGIHDVIIIEGQKPDYKLNGKLTSGYNLDEWGFGEIFRLAQYGGDIPEYYSYLHDGYDKNKKKKINERTIKKEIVRTEDKNESGKKVTKEVEAYVVDDVMTRLLGDEYSHDFTATVKNKVLRCHISKVNPGIMSLFIRVAPINVPSYSELNLPRGLDNAIRQSERGLVLVSGIVSSGKTTTANALINDINVKNSKDKKVVITAEDPIEYVHNDVNAKIIQRRVGEGRDTPSYAQAARDALRESANVVYLGEVRTWSDMENALQLAETGHLVITTVHSNSVLDTAERFVMAAPSDIQSNVRARFNENLLGIAYQELITVKDKRYPLITQFFVMDEDGRQAMRQVKNRENLEDLYNKDENNPLKFRLKLEEAVNYVKSVSGVEKHMAYDEVLEKVGKLN